MARRATSTEPPPGRAAVIRRGHRATVAEGAFVGGPFLLFVPFAFCAALLRQARTVLELAALAGRTPTELDRAAELLVLQGVHDDVPAARAALAAQAAGAAAAPTPGRLRRTAVLWALVMRMARLLGLLVPAEPGSRPRWAAQTARWLLLVAVFLVGLVAPLVWLPYMASNYDRATTRLTARAVRFYFPDAPDDVGPSRPRRRLDPAALTSAARALLSLLVPIAVTLGLLATDLRIAGGRWQSLTIALAAASTTAGAVWLWRRHSHHHGRRRGRGDRRRR